MAEKVVLVKFIVHAWYPDGIAKYKVEVCGHKL